MKYRLKYKQNIVYINNIKESREMQTRMKTLVFIKTTTWLCGSTVIPLYKTDPLQRQVFHVTSVTVHEPIDLPEVWGVLFSWPQNVGQRSRSQVTSEKHTPDLWLVLCCIWGTKNEFFSWLWKVGHMVKVKVTSKNASQTPDKCCVLFRAWKNAFYSWPWKVGHRSRSRSPPKNTPQTSGRSCVVFGA
jgi:hypothetical protein